mmetsp:Transcript_66492/g.172506  ORF Transcript_66492/g.172506 Transcript_66492/m.172506 type:complete len:250 (-) Transcript_66492:7-756(-)
MFLLSCCCTEDKPQDIIPDAPKDPRLPGMPAKTNVFSLPTEEDLSRAQQPIAAAPHRPLQEPEPEVDDNEMAVLPPAPDGLDEEDEPQPPPPPPPPTAAEAAAAGPPAGCAAEVTVEPAAEAAAAVAEAAAAMADAEEGSSPARSARQAAPELPPPFKVEIAKVGSRKIGLDVRHYTKTSLEVLKIKEGLIEDYNLQIQAGSITGFSVEVGDVIQEVNGFTGTANELLGKIATETRVALLIQRGLRKRR